jgi:hypothetical protein
MSSRPALGPTQPPIQWVQRALSPGLKRPVHEAYHLPPTTAEVKKTWVYHAYIHSPIRLYEVVLKKSRTDIVLLLPYTTTTTNFSSKPNKLIQRQYSKLVFWKYSVFESRLGHQPSGLRIFLRFISSSRKVLG